LVVEGGGSISENAAAGAAMVAGLKVTASAVVLEARFLRCLSNFMCDAQVNT
jgi:hypothetical protein